MKFSATTTISLRRIKVLKNTTKRGKSADWMRIQDASTGKTLHTGRPSYIKKVAAKQYGRLVK